MNWTDKHFYTQMYENDPDLFWLKVADTKAKNDSDRIFVGWTGGYATLYQNRLFQIHGVNIVFWLLDYKTMIFLQCVFALS